MANQVVWFDLPVRDLDRAIRFYSAVLGSPPQKHEMPGMKLAVLSHGENDVSGCLLPAGVGNTKQPTQDGPLLYFNCQGRLDEAIAAVEKNNGKLLQAKHSIAPHGF